MVVTVVRASLGTAMAVLCYKESWLSTSCSIGHPCFFPGAACIAVIALSTLVRFVQPIYGAMTPDLKKEVAACMQRHEIH